MLRFSEEDAFEAWLAQCPIDPRGLTYSVTRDGSGTLDGNELRNFLRASEDRRADKRHVFNVVLKFVVDDDDVALIMEDCDADGDGGIDRAEVLAAIARWQQLAEDDFDRKEASLRRSCACAVM